MKSWKIYRKLWGKKINETWNIANSLSHSHPYGINPTTHKPYKSASQFATALHKADKQREHYAKVTKALHLKETGERF